MQKLEQERLGATKRGRPNYAMLPPSIGIYIKCDELKEQKRGGATQSGKRVWEQEEGERRGTDDA